MQSSQRSDASSTLADVSFDGWVLRRRSGELFRDGNHVRIQDQPLRILEELVATPGELVTRQRLIERLWPKGVVEFDTSLNTAVRKLRAVLGDDPEQPRYIETVPRRGYRFIGRLGVVPGDGSASARPTVARSRVWPAVRLAMAALFTVAAIAWLAWPLAERPLAPQVGFAPSGSTTNAAAFELYLRAKERISQLMPNQPELPLRGVAPPRAEVLAWLDEALQLDPSFALAYALRARVHLDFFVSNLDVGADRLVAIRADLERARQLSQDPSVGSDVRGLYAAFVDVDPERGLRELGYGAGSADAASVVNQARVLTSMGRFHESEGLLRALLIEEPANQLASRMRVSNLVSEDRPDELIHLVKRLRNIGSAEADTRPWTYMFTGEAELDVPGSNSLGDSAPSPEIASEQLFALGNDLTLLRHAQRYSDVKRILDASNAENVRFASFVGAVPGLGRRPVAELRGWNELLLGNASAAAEAGRELLAFAAAQVPTRATGWMLHMLEAQGHVFLGDYTAAVRAARESLQASPPLPQVEAYRKYLAAMTYAWAGEHDESVALLEQLTTGVPNIGPVRVAREPLFTVPLQPHGGFQLLVTQLEQKIAANRALD